MLRNLVTKKIVEEIKKALVGFNENKMYDQMLKHYKILHLIDDKGKWVTPMLEKLSLELLPKDFTEEKSRNFVEKMGKSAEKNPYLLNFFNNIKNENFKELSEKVKMEGKAVFPDIVAVSIVYDRLTNAMYNNPALLESCMKIFDEERKKNDAFKHMSLFHKIKFLSVDYPVKNILIKAHKTGVVEPDSARFLLPLNILEATLADFITGHYNNAKTGWLLAKNRPGAKKVDPRTDEGPSKWADNKKGIDLSVPLPKQWADLYQTWNMAFVSQVPDFPYALPKLCIPKVANYQENPKEYMYNRVIALYLLLNHSEFEYIEKRKNNEPYIDWMDQKLTNIWGESNLECSKKYEAELTAKRKLHVSEDKRDIIQSRTIKMPVEKKQQCKFPVKTNLTARNTVSLEM